MSGPAVPGPGGLDGLGCPSHHFECERVAFKYELLLAYRSPTIGSSEEA